MKVIYKYPLAVQDVQTIVLPHGAQFLAVQMQHESPTIWALVDPIEPDESISVRIIGTGNPIPPGGLIGMAYIGTVQQMNGLLVWHVFAATD